MTPTMTALRNVAALAALAAFTSGCMVGPDYVRPTAPGAPAFKEAAGWKQGEPKDLAPRGAWWTPFGDPDLDALAQQVAADNLTVQVAAARVREAQAGVRIARAPLWPAVGATGTAVRRSQTAAPGVPSVSNNYNAAVDLSWELDLWGGIRRGVEASQSTAQATEADLAGAVLSMQALLAQDYLLLRVQDAEIKLLQTTVAAYETSLTLTRNQYAAGIVARGDVAQAEAQLASTKAQLLDAGVTRAQLEHAIAVLIGKPPAVFTIPTREFVPVFPHIPVALPSELLERRPDIAAAERRTAAANAQIGVAQAAFFPSLSLSAVYGVQSSVIGDLLTLPARYWALGPALVSQFIFDAGLRQAQKEQAIATWDETVATYRNTVLTGFQEVEDNLAALSILEREAAVQDDAVKAAREAVTIATNQYKAGTANYLAVIVLQAAQLNNERTALDILGRRLTSSVGLIKALGGGWSATTLAQATN
jgi:NodT family efflux transporter outer membrane factor (OMF) lipoprotein